MAIGLKAHTHLDRERVIAEMAPLLQKHLGNSLLAIAASGSFSRNTDGPYSDIELFAFVRSTPRQESAIRFIHDGLLVDVWLLTRDEYLDIFKSKVRASGNDAWQYIALNSLTPVLNEPFISELRGIPFPSSRQACRTALQHYWPLAQEATAKLLTEIERGDNAPVQFLYWLAVEKFCCSLAFWNERPFTTRAAILDETRSFPKLPSSFVSLLIKSEDSLAPKELGSRALAVFEEIEELLIADGFDLYARALDEFVITQSSFNKIMDRFGLTRVTRKIKLMALGSLRLNK